MSSQKIIALVSNDKVGKVMAGPGIRYFNLAKTLAKHFSVVLFVPDSCDLVDTNFRIKTYDPRHSSKDISRQLGNTDYLIAQSLRPPLLYSVKRKGIRYIADLYDPLTIEVLEYTAFDKIKTRQNVFDFSYYSLCLQLDAADHILCASEKQKDFYLGLLSDRRLINSTSYLESPDFSKFISILPFGLSADQPVAKNKKRLEEKFPQIKKTDKIIYWGGGIWNWLDSLSVVKAVEQISKKRGDIKLFFLGVRHPNPKIKDMEMAQKTLDYCEKNGLTNKSVFFNFEWTPYEERVDYLTRADIGISTHFNNLETRFSFRTRILDYLWADLPIVLTKGDSFADLAEKHNLGKVVDYTDPSGIATAILEILNNRDINSKLKNNIDSFKKRFIWDNLADNLVTMIKKETLRSKPLPIAQYLINSYKFYRAGAKKKFSKK